MNTVIKGDIKSEIVNKDRSGLSVRDWMSGVVQDMTAHLFTMNEAGRDLLRDQVYKIIERYRFELIDFLFRQPAWFYGREEKDEQFRQTRGNVITTIQQLPLEVGRPST
jgi:hypothetical protein